MKFAHRRSRAVIGALVAGLLIQGVVSPLNPSAAEAATIPIDPTNVYVNNYEGWGTSLAWFANVTGNWSNRNALADALFSQSTGLGLNIARYNVGGSAATQAGMRPGGLVRSYMNPDGTYDWTVDANQRWWLDAAKARGVNITEAFSNSAPYFMLDNGDTHGASNCGNNLKSDQYDDFANYMTTVVQHFRDSWGTTFRTVNPLNEPMASWWCQSGNQEGMHVDVAQQDQLIGLTYASLQSKGLTTGVSAPDESSPGQAQSSVSGYSAANRNILAQVNAHTYGGDYWQKNALSTYAASINKRLWMSEVDGSVGSYNPNSMASANWLGGRISEDLTSLRPAAWLLWQPVEDANNMANVENQNWGLIHADLTGTSQTFSYTKKYYAMMNYTKFIRPGMKILASTGNTVVAYNPTSGQTVIVVNNDGSSASNTFDLSRFTSTASTASVYRTSATENFASLGTVNISNEAFTHSSAATSITTYVINSSTAAPIVYNRLVARHSGLGVDVSGESTADGAQVIQWTPSTTATNQQWQFRAAPTAGYVNIVNRNSGKCIDVYGASTADMAGIVQWQCGTGANQEWQVITSGAYVQLKARHSGKCIDVPGQSTTNGTALVQYTCNSGTNQQFSKI